MSLKTEIKREIAAEKKYLRVICIICVVVYGVFACLGVAIAAGLVPLEAVADAMGAEELLGGPDAALYATITGIVIAAAYLIQVLFTIPVLRGIKNPSKMGLGVVLYGILTVAVGANLVMTVMRGGDITMLMPQLVADLFIFVDALAIWRARN